MKVFARYFSDNGLNFRLNTILQFGESWDVIGAAFLINPGSAKPIGELSAKELARVSSITGYTDDWRRFSCDFTMRQLEKVFNGWYVGAEHPLNGVILLFNLFNLRDHNLKQALDTFKTCKSPYLFTSNTDLERIDGLRRIYIGWGRPGKNDLYKYAKPIFERFRSNLSYYLSADFDDNQFYHPGFLNRSYRTKDLSKRILSDFHKG